MSRPTRKYTNAPNAANTIAIQREDKRQTHPDRHGHPDPSSRSRYPAPRTVSSDSRPKGLSIFSLRYRT